MDKEEKDFKVDLSNLTKIPAEEFERHFRDWMERDDVARGLQAKLRTDLIANFNKTSLGKLIVAQTTTTTTGGSTQRLTLSPLTLALNTLVAEFLYAQNCHFTLSVFCTEVPFRNTLPDFESIRFFRFTETEIADICVAISGGSVKLANALKHQIIRYYAANGNVSLLLLVLKALLETPIEAVQKPEPTAPETQPKGKGGIKTAEEKTSERNDIKAEVYNTSFRYLNKYLIILSKKVKEMAQQFENLQQQQRQQHQVDVTTARPLPRPRAMKSVRTRKYENLNRSLERITQNLKQMTHAKRRSKHVSAIVNAIEALATQFTKCATNFENVSKDFSGSATKSKEQIRQVSENHQLQQQPVQHASASVIEKQTETEVREKSYTDWVHEMRHTRNGQKFLDRIEISLRKALSKQKELLYNETEMKLRHQKELLKIRYKQKLMEHLSKHAPDDVSGETRQLNENIALHLKQFEAKHFDLLHKMRTSEAAIAKEQPPNKIIVEKFVERIQKKEPEKARDTDSSVLPSVKSRAPVLKDAVNTQKQLTKMVKSIAEQGRSVDHIVYDAKLRIQELENESNQLDLNFHAYLERQKLRKEIEQEATVKLCHNHAAQGSHKMVVREKQQKKKRQFREERITNEEDYSTRNETTRRSDAHPHAREGLSIYSSEQSSSPFEFKNPILEAKEKFFAGGRKFHDQNGRAFEMPELHLYGVVSKTETENDVSVDESLEPYFYNRNFKKKQSHMNIIATRESGTSGSGLTLHSTLEQTHMGLEQQQPPPQHRFRPNNNNYSNNNNGDNMSTSGQSSNESSLDSIPAPQQQPQEHRQKAIHKIKRQLFHADKTATAILSRNNNTAHAHANKNGVSVAEVQVQRERLNNNSNNNNKRKDSSNKETLMLQLQQSLVATSATGKASNDTNAVATTMTTTAIQSTSLVLQQSMEKMQQLFEQTQTLKQNCSNEKGSNANHTATTQQQEPRMFASKYDALRQHVNNNVADDDDDDDNEAESEIAGMSMSNNNNNHGMQTIVEQQQHNETQTTIENSAIANWKRKPSITKNYDKQFQFELQHQVDDNGSNSKIMQSLYKPKTIKNVASNSTFILHTHTTTATTQAQIATPTTAAASIDSNQTESSIDVEKFAVAVATRNTIQGEDEDDDDDDGIIEEVEEEGIEDDEPDLVEIGEIVERVNVNTTAIANATLRIVQLQTDAARTSSSNSSSIVLQLSTGGGGRGRGGEGDGRQSDDSDSGSDFWQ